MSERNKERIHMKYEVMDVCDMKYPDEFFDVAIDKSTIDALLCGDNAFINVVKMTKEVQRVMKTEGKYIAISYGTPENRS
jgi:ubiquinone/menaquinone biosynthesis C-methylase UbiE